jgi:hypothetical protein
MSIDQKSAEAIVAAINKASSLCNESLRIVKANESMGHVQVYGRLVGNFMGHSYTNILAPIWKALPAIEPPEMKEPYVEPEPMLSVESKAALSAFVMEARTALNTVKNLLPTEEATQILEFGGLPEVEQAVADIEEFLAKPRFRDEDT